MNMRRLLLSLLSLALLAPLSGRDYESDIPYRVSDEPRIRRMCRLDIAFDAASAGCPVIVWFHGGGLTSGAKETPDILQRDGAVVVGVGYRFVSEVDITETLDDAAAAVAWVVANISRYGGDVSKIYIAGHSAGGYIVNMIGLDKKYLIKYGVDADMLAAIVPYSGQVITHFAQRSKLGLDALTPVVDEFAPLFYVRADAPPMLIISGDRELELYGRYEENAYFVRMLGLCGHKDVAFYELEGFSHSDMAAPAHLLLLKYIKDRNNSLH